MADPAAEKTWSTAQAARVLSERLRRRVLPSLLVHYVRELKIDPPARHGYAFRWDERDLARVEAAIGVDRRRREHRQAAPATAG